MSDKQALYDEAFALLERAQALLLQARDSHEIVLMAGKTGACDCGWCLDCLKRERSTAQPPVASSVEYRLLTRALDWMPADSPVRREIVEYIKTPRTTTHQPDEVERLRAWLKEADAENERLREEIEELEPAVKLRYESVFDAIADTPEEAARMRAEADEKLRQREAERAAAVAENVVETAIGLG